MAVTIGGFPIVAKAQTTDASKQEVQYQLDDIDENGQITYTDMLSYTVKIVAMKYDKDSEEYKHLYSIHEEARKMSENQAEELLQKVLLNY